jgi:hypothetical protein
MASSLCGHALMCQTRVWLAGGIYRLSRRFVSEKRPSDLSTKALKH